MLPLPPPPLQPWQRQIFLASHRGDVDAIRKLIAEHPTENGVNFRDEANYTPLTIAIVQGRLSTVQALVAMGAVVEEADDKADETNAKSSFLSDYEVKPSTPVQVACEQGHLEIVRYLVDEGADPLRQHPQSGNLLHVATRYCYAHLLQWLVEDYGVPVDTPVANTGQTALHLASAMHQDRLVQWLLDDQGSDPCLQDNQGRTALHVAVSRHCKPEAVPLLDRLAARSLHVRDNNGRTALHVACYKRQTLAVQTLLQHDDSIEHCFALDSLGHSPLFEVALGGDEEDGAGLLELMLRVLRERGVEKTRILQELHRPDPEGWTALHHAIFCGEQAHVARLLDFGVPLTVPLANPLSSGLHLVGSGMRILWDRRAVQAPQAWPKQYQRVVDWMLRYGKWYVQHQAVRNGWPGAGIPPIPRCLEGLEDAFDVCTPKVSWNSVDNLQENKTDDTGDGCMSKLLLNHGATVTVTDRNGNLPFFLAAASGHVAEVFVQLRAAAHEGLFENLGKSAVMENSMASKAVAALSFTDMSLQCSNKRAVFVTPPRRKKQLRVTQLGE